MPLRYRGLSLVRQIKALHREAWGHSPLGAWQTTGIPMRYGTGTDWDEFHTPNRIPTSVTLHLLKAIYPAQPCTYAST